METYKNFADEQRRIRESFDPLLKLTEVRKILDVGTTFVMHLIETGELEAVSLMGKHSGSNGMRVTPASLRNYIERSKIN